MIYFDTSALVKLVVEEKESEALEHWLRLQEETYATSTIGQVELIRVCRRVDSAAVAAANLLLGDLLVLPLTDRMVHTAENIGSPHLRALDALHLAAAYEVSDELTGFVAYDKRLRDAAALSGFAVRSPGMA